jgi:hypothetical protein
MGGLQASQGRVAVITIEICIERRLSHHCVQKHTSLIPYDMLAATPMLHANKSQSTPVSVHQSSFNVPQRKNAWKNTAHDLPMQTLD